MAKVIPLVVLAIAGIFCVDVAMAQVADPNQPNAYPDPQCTKPDIKLVKPPRPKGIYDWGPVNTYNSKVEAYNRESNAYNLCMHAYIDNANREVKTIQDQAKVDLKRITDTANARINVVQDKIRQAVADANGVAAAQGNATAGLRGP